MAKVQIPNFRTLATIKASQLATWLDANRDVWWRVDGEARLTEQVDFPCPGDELAAFVRTMEERTLEILSDKERANQVPEIDADTFENYADRNNRYSARNFLLRWLGERRMWLLSEDVPATESSSGED